MSSASCCARKAEKPPIPAKRAISPEYSASLWSRIMFNWVTPLFIVGNQRPLQDADLFALSRNDDVQHISDQFEAVLKDRMAAKNPKPVRSALWALFKGPMFKAGLVKFCNSTIQFAPSLLLNGLLGSIANRSSANPTDPVWAPYIWSLGLFVSGALRVLIENNYFHRVMRVGIHARSAITAAVYRKSLRMSPVARQETPVGKIVNLMQQDASRMEMVMTQLHVLWDAIYQIAGYMVLLGIFVQWSSLAGLASMLLLIPIQAVFMSAASKRRAAVASATDSRIKITNEALQGVRTLKQYNWESAYEGIISGEREKELSAIWRYVTIGTINSTIMQTAPLVVGVVTLLVFAASGGEFSAARVFSALAVLNQLRFPLMFFPSTLAAVADANVSLDRLTAFLQQPEVEMFASPATSNASGTGKATTATGTGAAAAAVQPASSSASAADSAAVAVTPASAAATGMATAGAPTATAAGPHPLSITIPDAHAPTSAPAPPLPPNTQAGITISNAVFYHEDPVDRKARIARKMEEKRKAAEAAAKKNKGGKGTTTNSSGSSASGPNASGGGKGATTAVAAAASSSPTSPVSPSAGATSPSSPSPATRTATPSAGAASASGGHGARDEAADIPPILSNLSISIPKGQLWAIIGPVGVGKTSLCMAILGEMHRAQGSVSINGRVGYAAQSAWIINSSVKNNITFAGNAMKEQRTATQAGGAATGATSAPSLSNDSELHGESRYQRVVDVCHLRHDISTLPAGDSTEIGERGVNLSGGQKQRVALARLAYAADSADICVMDDPLSALDAEVAKAVFDDCIKGFLGHKTRLLVTNALNFLPQCDGVVMLGNDSEGRGYIKAQGSFASLLAGNEEFAGQMAAYGYNPNGSPTIDNGGGASPASSSGSNSRRSSTASSSTNGEGEEVQPEQISATVTFSVVGVVPNATPMSDATGGIASAEAEGEAAAEASLASASTGNGAAATEGNTTTTATATTTATKTAPTTATGAAAATGGAGGSAIAGAGSDKVSATANTSPSGALMTLEEKAEGSVKAAVYWAYIQSCGYVWAVIPIILLAFILAQLGQLVSQWWLTYWTTDASYKNNTIGFYQGIYVAIGVGTAIITYVRTQVQACASVRASRNLHKSLMHTILHAPQVFFDTTPLGRILARFSKDFDAIDNQLSNNIGMMVMCTFYIIGSIAAMIFSTPWFAIAIVPLLLFYYRVTTYFRNVARETKRFDALTRSPIFAHFSETLNGLTTIRAFGLIDSFSHQNATKLSANVATFYSLRSCDRWLSIRLELIGSLIVLAAALLASGTASNRSEGSSAGLAGFSLSWAISITAMLNWVVRTFAETEQTMNSVERVMYYNQMVPQEPYAPPPGSIPPPKSWPETGSVVFKSYSMRYRRNTPKVLKNLTFAVRGGEKIGIVGRTGAGKSSIMQALFRMIEDECCSGEIYIDGQEIHQLGLNTLRSQLAIIPQDPVMFSGTMRSNLDPVGRLKSLEDGGTAVLLDALTKVGLRDAVMRMPGGLDAVVSEFATNISAGQRQLACMARVLLRQTKIVLLDEASSSLDHETDVAIQRAIREAFAASTMLIIAHRLNTIIGCDRVLVMDNGQVAEFAHPHELLTSPNGSIFASLVDETGYESAATLRALAAESYRAKMLSNSSGSPGGGLGVPGSPSVHGEGVQTTVVQGAGASGGTGNVVVVVQQSTGNGLATVTTQQQPSGSVPQAGHTNASATGGGHGGRQEVALSI